MKKRKFTTNQGIEFFHLIGEKEEEETMKSISANFYSIKENDVLLFVHVTKTENVDSILEKGLISGSGHFGEGVYVCSFDYIESLKAFMSFVYNIYIEKPFADLSFVIGAYSGEYLRCLYGDLGHTGYILIEKNVNKEDILCAKKIDKEEFLEFSLESLRDYLNLEIEKKIFQEKS